MDGKIKCNVTGVIRQFTSISGLGSIFRDHEGKLCAAYSETSLHVYSRLQAEAMALLKAVQRAIQGNLEEVQFESNSYFLVKMLQADEGIDPRFDTITTIKNLLRDRPSYNLAFVKRHGNHVAFKLALEALYSFSSDSWFNVAPLLIRDAIISDCNR